MSSDHDLQRLPAGLYGPDAVDVAYEPWRAVRATTLRLGPDARAGAVLDDAGRPVALVPGQHLGRQSTRNPTCLDAPPLRPAADGFVWGYCMPPAIRKSGWMRLADLEPDLGYPDLACGPAGVDFDRRRPQACGGHCDGQPLTDIEPAGGRSVVGAREVYLRYAPGSTPFRYLLAGDTVRRLAGAHEDRWLGVEVVSAHWASRATRGWVLTEALRPLR
jgi:hypothetical protein